MGLVVCAVVVAAGSVGVVVVVGYVGVGVVVGVVVVVVVLMWYWLLYCVGLLWLVCWLLV